MVAVGTTAASESDKPNDARAMQFIRQYEATVRPLEIETNLLWWTASLTGKEEDFRKKQAAEEKLDLCLANPQRFAELKAIRQSGVSDPLLARQIDVLYRKYLSRQIPPELLKNILAKENEAQRAFNVFRPTLDGKEVTNNDLRRILIESRDSDELRAAWEAGKKVGPVVLADLKELVALRNQAARQLGFSDYYAVRLFLGEQDRKQLIKLFDELDELTRGPFHEAKLEMDAALAEHYGITVDELRPWHYHDPFFQEAPATPGALPESVYKSLDAVEVCRKFYEGIGLPVDDVLARSDLYEKPGKNPHAFATDIDRSGDVRIFENVVPGREWLTTTMHELGHAAYSKNIGRGKGVRNRLCEAPSGPFRQTVPDTFSALPYVLRSDAHPLCTEGVAMMFDRFPLNVDWLRAMGADVPNPERYRAAAAKLRRNRLLVFARWAQVMFRFETALYADPDQDLDRLWWDLVEKYQEIKRPEGRDEPDFAAKYHIVGAPAYYHNYMLGEMFASQVHHALIDSVLPGTNPAGAIYVGNKAVGEFLIRRVFAPGLTLNWNELTRHATGAELSPKAFAEDIKTQNAN
ncbi:MAG: M2 family metallopeptidase [Planctomycetes bacterium]|nr:M2 family metallopeptidase [Planctomycetota bacterium]